MNDDNVLTPETRSRLSKMAGDRATVSADLEERVVSRLRHEGAFVRSRGRWRLKLMAACATLAFFVGGVFAGRTIFRPSAPEFNYVLLLEEDEAYHRSTDLADTEHRVDEYRQWALQLRTKGVPISGLKLQTDSSAVATGLKFRELAGLFMVKAADAAEAQRIAETCPHIRYGGGIVIRPIART
jgi:hypothetical protein